jgi:hypothetical protein
MTTSGSDAARGREAGRDDREEAEWAYGRNLAATPPGMDPGVRDLEARAARLAAERERRQPDRDLEAGQ